MVVGNVADVSEISLSGSTYWLAGYCLYISSCFEKEPGKGGSVEIGPLSGHSTLLF